MEGAQEIVHIMALGASWRGGLVAEPGPDRAYEGPCSSPGCCPSCGRKWGPEAETWGSRGMLGVSLPPPGWAQWLPSQDRRHLGVLPLLLRWCLCGVSGPGGEEGLHKLCGLPAKKGSHLVYPIGGGRPCGDHCCGCGWGEAPEASQHPPNRAPEEDSGAEVSWALL